MFFSVYVIYALFTIECVPLSNSLCFSIKVLYTKCYSYLSKVSKIQGNFKLLYDYEHSNVSTVQWYSVSILWTTFNLTSTSGKHYSFVHRNHYGPETWPLMSQDLTQIDCYIIGACEFHDLLGKSQRIRNLLQKSIHYGDCISGNKYFMKQAKNSAWCTRLRRGKRSR